MMKKETSIKKIEDSRPNSSDEKEEHLTFSLSDSSASPRQCKHSIQYFQEAGCRGYSSTERSCCKAIARRCTKLLQVIHISRAISNLYILVFEFILQPGFTTYVIIRKIIFKNGKWEYALKFIHKIVVERDLLI